MSNVNETPGPFGKEISTENSDFFQAENEEIHKLVLEENKRNRLAENTFESAEYLEQLLCCGEILPDSDNENETDEEIQPFKRKAKKMLDISNGQGLVFKRTIDEGSGIVIPNEALAIFDYMLYFEDSDEPFDSSINLGRPERQRINSGQLVEGLNWAVSSMRKGERAAFVLDSSVMFGIMGCIPRVPKKADVCADVRLIDFIERNRISSFFDMTKEEQQELPLKEHLEVAIQCRQDGNSNFNSKRFANAASKYLMAIDVLSYAPVSNDEEEKERSKQRKLLNSNLATTVLKLNRPRQCIKYCNVILQTDPKDKKARYRKAEALDKLCEFAEAKQILLQLYREFPSDLLIQKLLDKVEKNVLNTRSAERQIYQKMFSNYRKTATTTTSALNSNNSKERPLSPEMVRVLSTLESFVNDPNVSNSMSFQKEAFAEEELLEVIKMAKALQLNPEEKENTITFKKP